MKKAFINPATEIVELQIAALFGVSSNWTFENIGFVDGVDDVDW